MGEILGRKAIAATLRIVGLGSIVSGCGAATPTPAGVVPDSEFVEAVAMSPSPETKRHPHMLAGMRQHLESTGGAPFGQKAEVHPDALSEEVVTTEQRLAPSTSVTPPPAPPLKPGELLAQVNESAAQYPTKEDFESASMTYTYVEGDVYHVYAAPRFVTELALEPGEKVQGELFVGDAFLWKLGSGETVAGGVVQQTVTILPKQAGLETNLIVYTDRRKYHIHLASLEKDALVTASWRYPHSRYQFLPSLDTPVGVTAGEAKAALSIDGTQLDSNYTVKVTSGAPTWKVETVYNDGERTYIRFGSGFEQGESPMIHVVRRGRAEVANWIVKGRVYVVNGTFGIGELRLGAQPQKAGDEPQDIVRITRL